MKLSSLGIDFTVKVTIVNSQDASRQVLSILPYSSTAAAASPVL